jgi:hypothetical protein
MTTWETVMTNAINNANGPDIATIKAGCDIYTGDIAAAEASLADAATKLAALPAPAQAPAAAAPASQVGSAPAS